jgi:K+-transporting ATPase ATPase C chain
MKTQILIAIKLFALLTLLLGLAYPLLITGIAQLAFPEKANGSLIVQGNKVIGSKLIGQKFDSEFYFWSRPSATDYGTMPSGGSNLGPTSSRLKQLVAGRAVQFTGFNQLPASETIPSEMLLASASGLDPHISPRAAMLQVERIVKARQFDNEKKQKLILSINELAEAPQFTFLGENRVNVLMLNIELDKLDGKHSNNN